MPHASSLLIFLSCVCWGPTRVLTQLSPEVQQLADDFFNWRLADKPEFASLVGVHDYDDQLDDMSLAAYQNRYDQCQVFLDQAEALEANLTLNEDLVNIRALKDELVTYIDGYPFQGFLVPLCSIEGVHIDLETLISWMVFETPEDYEKLLSRYEKLPQQLKQIQALMEEGVATGIVNHAISMEGVVEGLQRFVVEVAEESPLWSPLSTFPDNITQDQISDFQNRARTIIVDQVSPAFQQLSDYVNNDYVTRPDIGVTSLPNGEAFYSQLIRFHTTTSMTAAEIYQLGLDEVTRIEALMAEIVAELGYNMTVAEFSEMIRNDPEFFYDNPDDLMNDFDDLVHNVITPKLPEVFMNIPKAELIVQADPSPSGAGAYYLSGSYDGSRPGKFYVNTYYYDAQAKYEMLTLSMHEGNPGHHLQGSHSIESPDIPYFRRVTEDRDYWQAPSRFPLYTGFIEGWGLYAETLGFNLDLYGDPYDRYGHYSDEIFRACRLVVDTGMHTFGWTRQEAVDYMLLHTALAQADIENEIDRYISWPGQALAYKVGERKLTELREKAASQLGDVFDIKKFHDVVLDSVGPLALVEEEVDAWIEAGGV
nr:uncharacterized protein LOC123751404 [Procambarus clarkii]